MFVQTTRKTLWFGGVLLHLGLAVVQLSAATSAWMTVSVYNDASVPAGAMASAEATASAIFRQAGLEIEWIPCAASGGNMPESTSCSEAAYPRHVHVRILSRSRNLASSTLGVSYLSSDGTGCYSDIFFVPVAELHSTSGQEVGTILGQAMAHEIAHLLLGTNSHSAIGIMRAQWQREKLLRAGKGEMLFTRAQAQVMRERLAFAARQAVGD